MSRFSRAENGAIVFLGLLAAALAWWAVLRPLDVSPAAAPAPPPPLASASASLPPLRLPVNLNTADSATLVRLPGIHGPLARRIVRYRTAAGGFRSWAQVQRVWGMDSLLPRLQPMLTLGTAVADADARGGWAPAGRSERPARPPGGRSAAPSAGAQPLRASAIPPTPIDLNTADSAALEALPGIGPTFARRIVAYRARLGFYHRVEQLREVYGMPDSLYQIAAPYLQVGDLTDVERLNVNAYSQAELATHPYVGQSLARRLVAFRLQHGPFRQPEDLRKVYGIDAQRLERLGPYLRFD